MAFNSASTTAAAPLTYHPSLKPMRSALAMKSIHAVESSANKLRSHILSKGKHRSGGGDGNASRSASAPRKVTASRYQQQQGVSLLLGGGSGFVGGGLGNTTLHGVNNTTSVFQNGTLCPHHGGMGHHVHHVDPSSAALPSSSSSISVVPTAVPNHPFGAPFPPSSSVANGSAAPTLKATPGSAVSFHNSVIAPFSSHRAPQHQHHQQEQSGAFSNAMGERGGGGEKNECAASIDDKIAALEHETATCQKALCQQEAAVAKLQGAYTEETGTLVALKARLEEVERRRLLLSQQNAVAREALNQSHCPKSATDLLLEKLADKYMRSQYKKVLESEEKKRQNNLSQSSQTSVPPPIPCSLMRPTASSIGKQQRRSNGSAASSLPSSSVTTPRDLAATVCENGNTNNTIKEGPAGAAAVAAVGGSSAAVDALWASLGRRATQQQHSLTLADLEGLVDAMTDHAKRLQDECDAHYLARTKGCERKTTAQRQVGQILANNTALEGDVTQQRAALQRRIAQRNEAARAVRELEKKIRENEERIAVAEKATKEVSAEMEKTVARRAKHDQQLADLIRSHDALASLSTRIDGASISRQAMLKALREENEAMGRQLQTIHDARKAVMTTPLSAVVGVPQPVNSSSEADPPMSFYPAAPQPLVVNVQQYAVNAVGLRSQQLSAEDALFADMFDTLMRTVKKAEEEKAEVARRAAAQK